MKAESHKALLLEVSGLSSRVCYGVAVDQRKTPRDEGRRLHNANDNSSDGYGNCGRLGADVSFQKSFEKFALSARREISRNLHLQAWVLTLRRPSLKTIHCLSHTAITHVSLRIPVCVPIPASRMYPRRRPSAYLALVDVQHQRRLGKTESPDAGFWRLPPCMYCGNMG